MNASRRAADEPKRWRFTEGQVRAALDSFYSTKGIVPSSAKTWGYTPSEASLTVSIKPSQGVRVALRLLWDSLRAALDGETVTFEMRSEPKPPYTFERDEASANRDSNRA